MAADALATQGDIDLLYYGYAINMIRKWEMSKNW